MTRLLGQANRWWSSWCSWSMEDVPSSTLNAKPFTLAVSCLASSRIRSVLSAEVRRQPDHQKKRDAVGFSLHTPI